jgi:hypothetical protein
MDLNVNLNEDVVNIIIDYLPVENQLIISKKHNILIQKNIRYFVYRCKIRFLALKKRFTNMISEFIGF